MSTTRRIRHSLLLVLAAASVTMSISGVARATPPAPGEAPPTMPAPEAPPAADPAAEPLNTGSDDVAPTTAAAVTTTLAPSTTLAPTTTPAPSTTQGPTTTAPANDPNGQSAMLVVSAASAASNPLSPSAKPGNANVTLTWAAPSSNGGAAIDKYRVQRATSNAGPWTTIATPIPLNYLATGLTNGTQYYFRIAAHNSAGWSPYSSIVSAVPRTVPSAPQSPTAMPGNGSVALSWAAPSGNGGAAINKYAVERSTSSAGPWTRIATPNMLSYTATGLTNGTQYYFRILAHNSAGWGTPSTGVSAKPRTVPNAPLATTATPYSGIVKLAWVAANNGGAPVDKYDVQRATSAAGPWTSVGYPTTTLYTNGSLSNGTTYYYRIRAHNAAGWSSPTAVVSAKPIGVPTTPRLCTVFQADEGSDLVWFKFIAPLSDGGAPIEFYRLQIYEDSALTGEMVGDVEMEGGDTAYEGAAAVLPFRDDYVAQIWAYNSEGYSPYCAVSFDMNP